jgi:CheY-like chemotaxis protein
VQNTDLKHVLIVEDDNAVREAMAEVLGVEGKYAVVQARDGADALMKARAEHPDIILLDLMMPRMSGWQFLDAQRLDPSVSSLPVIVVSALEPEKTPVLEGVVGRLFKPFDIEGLLGVLERYFALAA